MRYRAQLLLVTLAALTACTGPQTPTVERADDGAIVPLRLRSFSGTRDGYIVAARLVFAGGEVEDRTEPVAATDDLQVDMTLEAGVPSRFRAGRFHMRLAGAQLEGDVTSTSLTFLGGQGGPPAVGGTFLLHGPDGRPRYRITLPPIPLESPAP